MADGNHVLIANCPDHTLVGSRAQKMNMGAYQAGWVRAVKLFNLKLVASRYRYISSGCFTQIDIALAQVAKDLQPGFELLGVRSNQGLWVGRKRVGVHSGYENGSGAAIYSGHLAVRPAPQRSPQSGLLQLFGDRLITQGSQSGGFMTLKPHRVALVINLYNKRLKSAAITPIDGNHLARGGSGINHARSFLVFEYRLAKGDTVPLLYQHGWLHTDVVTTQKRYRLNRTTAIYSRIRLASDREVESLLD